MSVDLSLARKRVVVTGAPRRVHLGIGTYDQRRHRADRVSPR